MCPLEGKQAGTFILKFGHLGEVLLLDQWNIHQLFADVPKRDVLS